MTTNLPVITSSNPKQKKKSDSIITKWTVFSLCLLTTLVAVSLIKAYFLLLVSTLAMLFVWSQMTKPVAEIETKTTNDDSKQLNLFHRRYKIGNKYTKIKKVLEEGQKVA